MMMHDMQPLKIFMGLALIAAIGYLAYLISKRNDENEGTTTGSAAAGDGGGSAGGGDAGSNSTDDSSNAGAIAGGVIAGIIVIGAIAWVATNEGIYRRNRVTPQMYIEMARTDFDPSIKTIEDMAKSTDAGVKSLYEDYKKEYEPFVERSKQAAKRRYKKVKSSRVNPRNWRRSAPVREAME